MPAQGVECTWNPATIAKRLLEFVLWIGAACLPVVIHRLSCSRFFTSLKAFTHFPWSIENILVLTKLEESLLRGRLLFGGRNGAGDYIPHWDQPGVYVHMRICVRVCAHTHAPQKSWRLCNWNTQNQNVKRSKYQNVVILVHIYKDLY